MSTILITIICFIIIIIINDARINRDIVEATRFFHGDKDKFNVLVKDLIGFGDEQIYNFTHHYKPIGIVFSGVFTNNIILQREPYYSSIYGTCDTSNTSIILYLQSNDNDNMDIYSTISMINGDWKILLNKTYKNGGNYTITVICNECNGTMIDNQKSLYNVTFGDIYFCSGQSNMNLEMHFTFNRNFTYKNITQFAKYSNIRFYTKRHLATKYKPYVIPLENEIINGKYQWHQSWDISSLSRFSATCWYMAQSLIDLYNMTNINFGLIQSGVDASKIESWIINNTISNYCKPNTTTTIQCPGPDCGAFYNGMILPFINMTIKAIIWYQGENNLVEDDPNIENNNNNNNSGYSCMQKLMLEQWRNNWSVIPLTTHKLVPFGVVQLAAGTSEGHQDTIAHFRWTQSNNYGILPNPQMINTFIAQSYDLGM